MPAARTRPVVAFVISIYGGEPFLPAFLGSLDEQGDWLDRVQLIFVDDGSPDASMTLIEAWLTERGRDAVLVRKPNGGLSSARNAGLERVDADWVSFPDADDVLGPQYLRSVIEYLESPDATAVSVVGTDIRYLDDATGRIDDTHPLRFKFDGAAHSRLLREAPHYLHLQSASGFYRTDVIADGALRFDVEIVPVAEDIEFTTRYLLRFDDPAVGVVPAAQYRYRRRQGSLVNIAWTRAERFTVIPERVHLGVLEAARARFGAIPAWVQNVVLYDLQWYFKDDLTARGITASTAPEVLDAFFAVTERTLRRIDEDAILAYRATHLPWEIRWTWLAMRGSALPDRALHVVGRDADGVLTASYLYAGERPDEVLTIAGRPVEPLSAVDRDLEYLGRAALVERTVRLPAGGWLEARIDGAAVPIVVGPPAAASYVLTEHQAGKQLASASASASVPNAVPVRSRIARALRGRG